jgi:hypothetical protein
MAKPITFYATEEDQKTIEAIQEIKPHWSNMNFILREALQNLLKSLRRAEMTSFPETYQPTSQPRFIRED